MNHLDPKSVWLFFIQFVSGWVVFLMFFGWWIPLLVLDDLFRLENFKILAVNTVLIALSVIVLMGILYAKLTYRFYRYELSQLGFKKEYGIIWKTYVTIPYDRIQNVDVYRGIWARILGLSDLQIHTAGAGSLNLGEGRLPALSRAVAEYLRDELLIRSRRARADQGL